MTITELYSIAHDIPEYMKDRNKYTWLGYNKILEVKYLDVNDSMKNKLPINNFINENGEVLLIPNIVNDKIIDLQVKAIDSKKMLVFKDYDLPYNIGNLKDFKYGDPLFVVEGMADVGGIKLIDPSVPVVALKTNSITNDMYDVYKNITNNIVLVLDNDSKGQMHLTKIRLKLKELGVTTNTINQFGNLKDTGEIVEMIMRYYKNKSSSSLLELNNVNLYYKAQIKLLKN